MIRFFFRVTKFFPINNNKILFFSFSGKSFTCNPKYLYLKLLSVDKNYSLYWALRSTEQFKYLNKMHNTHVVRYGSIRYFITFFTAKIIITNDTFYPFLLKKKKQILIQTWHGGGAYKKVGLDLKGQKLTSFLTYRTLNEADVFLSSSKAFTLFNIKSGFDYRGRVLTSGLPRNDILINDHINHKAKIKDKLKLSNFKLIILFAPTYTKTSEEAIDFEVILETFSVREKISLDDIILIRKMHHKVIKNEEYIDMKFNYLDLSNYPDVQDLLVISDILITNYSSIIWDFSLLYKEGYLYVPDLQDYTLERSFYIDIDKWPYPKCLNTRQLVDEINSYDYLKLKVKITNHHNLLGSYEKGKATEIAIEEINKIMEKV